MIDVVHFTDPGCPWAYSASPALAVMRWRYGAGLRWRLVTVGLAEDPERYVRSGYTPARMATGYATFRARFGMPFAATPKPRVSATSRACRAIVATRLDAPEREWSVFRALQVGNFTTPLVLDSDEAILAALRRVGGLDADAIFGRLDDDDVRAAYEADKAETRRAAGSPTDAQGKAGTPTALSATPRRRSSSPPRTAGASRPAGSSASRPTTSASRTSSRRSSGARPRTPRWTRSPRSPTA